MTWQAGQFSRLFDLTGRVAVVTGGTGLLGQFFCACLADHGAHVVVVDLDADAVGTFARDLERTFGTPCLGVACDVTNADAVKRMADEAEQQVGAIAILHNNAAGTGKSLDQFYAPLNSYDERTWREVMAVNLDSAFLVAREIGSRMARRGRGSIIQTASIYGVVAPDQRIYEGSKLDGRSINTPAVYSASKAGIIGLTRYLATYWGDCGVRANTITPGGVFSGQNETFTRLYSARVPMGRMANPDELAGTLLYLASDASSYVNGQNIVVDGGLTAW